MSNIESVFPVQLSGLGFELQRSLIDFLDMVQADSNLDLNIRHYALRIMVAFKEFELTNNPDSFRENLLR